MRTMGSGRARKVEGFGVRKRRRLFICEIGRETERRKGTVLECGMIAFISTHCTYILPSSCFADSTRLRIN